MSDYRDDDVGGRGYCPVCRRSMSVDVALFGFCEEHGRQAADFDTGRFCPACSGTGFETTDPEDASRCLDCGGSGVRGGWDA